MTIRMWWDIAFIGSIMAVATLLVLDAVLPGGFVPGSGDMRYGQTMAFTTLMLCQMFNVLSARSDDRSAFAQPFRNRWLWTAIAVSLMLQVAVVHAAFLQAAFGTVNLSATDWMKCTVRCELRPVGRGVAQGGLRYSSWSPAIIGSQSLALLSRPSGAQGDYSRTKR